nr:hypothetical protein [Tanacetum cinerariifolium]
MFDCDDYLSFGSDESFPPSPIYDSYQSGNGPVSTAVPKICVTRPRQAKTVVTKTNSPPRRLINLSPSTKASNFPPNVTVVKALMVNAAQGVNTPRCDEDRLELMELMVFLLLSDEKVRVEVSAVDLQFWTSIAVKKVNDVTRLQALADKKKVIVSKATIREALRLDDAEGRKFNFSKYIFNILVRNVDSPTKFYMYPHFLQLMIKKQVGDLSSHYTKYTSPALTQKVFANMRRVGKTFFGVDTLLFEGMLVVQEVGEGDADEVHVKDINAASVATEGVVSATDDVVPTADEEPSIPSPTPPTPSPQPSQDQPSTSQVYLTPPQSPQPQPQPSQDAGISMKLL